MTASQPQHKQVRTLVRLLAEQAQKCDDLVAIVDRKIAAMRASDVNALRVAVKDEADGLEQLRQRDALRRQLVAQIVRAHGLGAARAEGLTIKQLAERFAGPSTAALESVGDRLREALARLHRRSRIAQMIADTVLQHVRAVFTAITGAVDQDVPYGATGGLPVAGAHRVIDAIG